MRREAIQFGSLVLLGHKDQAISQPNHRTDRLEGEGGGLRTLGAQVAHYELDRFAGLLAEIITIVDFDPERIGDETLSGRGLGPDQGKEGERD